MIDKEKLPVHVALIMDGNGRWAKNQGLPRTKGHTAGLKQAKEIVRTASELGIKYVTLYVFSTENWKRAKRETGFLMDLIHVHLKAEFEFYKKYKVRLRHIGDRNGLPEKVLQDIDEAVAETANYVGTTVSLAINYGGRDELVRAFQKMSAQVSATSGKITESDLGKALDVPEMPDVDLLIRTGGELRLSNFLLWQASYAELVFTDTLWPNYTSTEFYKNIEEFQHRNRRFGDAK